MELDGRSGPRLLALPDNDHAQPRSPAPLRLMRLA
jgi:hypothetical protein